MKFIFYISKKYSIPIVQPIAKYLDTTEHDYAFFVSRKVEMNLPRYLIGKNVIKTLRNAIDYQPQFVLVPGNFVDFRIPGIKIQIFHGLGVEKSSHYRIRHFFDCYCTSGPLVTAKFQKLQKKHRYFKIMETGWPKVDHILNFHSARIRTMTEIPLGKKIILFAPTHSRRLQSATKLMKLLPLIIKRNEFLLIKFHELMNNELIAEFKLNIQGRALCLYDYDITPYLHAADVLISDTSSVLYEFMLLDKPVITYRTKDRPDKGIDVADPNMLRDAIDWSLKNPTAHSEIRRKHLLEINPYLDGNISERLINKLIANKSELDKVKKPLNLYRKMQILYHQKFRKGYLR